MIMDRLHTDLRITTLLALANVIATGMLLGIMLGPARKPGGASRSPQ
jgi:hypothetical protein